MAAQSFTSFVFNSPTKLLFGAGKLGELHNEKLPGKKALLLTSRGQSIYKNGSFDKTVGELRKAGVDFLHSPSVVENPGKEDCEAAGRLAHEEGCDFIVALGGGAVLDSSVAVSIIAANPERDLWDFVFGGTGKGQTAPNDPLPIVTAPAPR